MESLIRCAHWEFALMCFSTKTPTPPMVQAQPRRDETSGAVADQRRKLAAQGGVYDNIATTPLGDSNYGSAASSLPKLAAFGA